MSKFDLIRDCKHGHQKGKCDSCDLEQAADLIEQQQQRIAELERYKQISDVYLDIYNCKKCNGLVNRGYICFGCGDTNPSEYKGVEDA